MKRSQWNKIPFSVYNSIKAPLWMPFSPFFFSILLLPPGGFALSDCPFLKSDKHRRAGVSVCVCVWPKHTCIRTHDTDMLLPAHIWSITHLYDFKSPLVSFPRATSGASPLSHLGYTQALHIAWYWQICWSRRHSLILWAWKQLCNRILWRQPSGSGLKIAIGLM